MERKTWISLDDLREVVEKTCLDAGLTPLRAKQEADGNVGRVWRLHGSKLSQGIVVSDRDASSLLESIRTMFLKGRKPAFKEVNDVVYSFFESKK